MEHEEAARGASEGAEPGREPGDASGAVPGRSRAARGSLLFPAEPRPLPGRRAWKIGLRAVHALCAGLLVGCFVLEAGADAHRTWLWATALSGLAILLLDLHESGAFLLQARGLFVLLKLALLGAVPSLDAAAGPVLIALFLLSVLVSHAPSSVRYRVLIGGKHIRGSQSRG